MEFLKRMRGGERKSHFLNFYMPSAFFPLFSLLTLTVTGEVGIIIHFTEEKPEAGAEVMACRTTYSSHAAGLLWEFLQSLSKALASCH